MDYSQLSDFEINKRVAEIIYKDKDGLFVARNLPSREEVTIVAEVNSEDICIAAADYCNNWSDGGPVIEKNLIRITPMTIGGSSAWVCSRDIYAGTSLKPLRAAMIVFLMMQDAKHA